MMSRDAHRNRSVPPLLPNADRASLGLSDSCPHCAGDLRMILGTPSEFRARCRDCGDIWVQGDDLRWKRDRLPLRTKVALAALPVLLWIAGHVEVPL